MNTKEGIGFNQPESTEKSIKEKEMKELLKILVANEDAIKKITADSGSEFSVAGIEFLITKGQKGGELLYLNYNNSGWCFDVYKFDLDKFAKGLADQGLTVEQLQIAIDSVIQKLKHE